MLALVTKRTGISCNKIVYLHVGLGFARTSRTRIYSHMSCLIAPNLKRSLGAYIMCHHETSSFTSVYKRFQSIAENKKENKEWIRCQHVFVHMNVQITCMKII